jgi:hypothetical protein
MFRNSNVTDVISGAEHAHCFGTVMSSHYCSETVNMSCSTNDIRHITVPTCSLFRNSNVTDVISGAGHAHCFGTVM